MKKQSHRIKKIIYLIIVIVGIIVAYEIYSKYNYNDFVKSVSEVGKTNFTRDKDTKCSEMDSYKIENIDYHDAMFSKDINIIPNTPYKVSCKVKVENVENLDNKQSGGAQICINGTTERSKTIAGTSDWQDLEFYFNSKNRTQVNLGFRLGGYAEKSKGTAWFSDFKLEAGTPNNSSNWKMVCFIFPNIDVNVEINGKKERVNLQMSDSDIATIKTNLSRYSNSISEISQNKMSVEYEVYTISEPITTLSYDEKNGYYVSDTDVYKLIDRYLQKKEYDHIYVAFRMTDKQKKDNVLVSDWIGLGGMDYFGIGFSNIRMTDDNYSYEYNYLINRFPEEVFIHEFLHTLERNAEEYGYEIPALHDYTKYGYMEDSIEGLRKWYTDYMNGNISYNGQKIGLPSQIYKYKPVHESNFTHSTIVDELKEPSNIIEIIISLFSRVGKLFSYIGQK